MRAVIVLLIAVIFITGIYFANQYYQKGVQIIPSYEISTNGYVETNVDIVESTLRFYTDCYSLSMDISDDQAYSIKSAIGKKIISRPLTHDIMKDILDNYDFDILMIRIESYENEIYYAKIILKKENKVLELDARPSDATALAIRMDEKIYFNEDVLEERGVKSC